MPEHVRITDVAARDGLQNEPTTIATTDKIRLVELLARSGVDEIELTSFVSRRWIPQLGDAAEVCAAVATAKPEGVQYSALVPNEAGMRAALAADEAAGGGLLDKVAVFTAASETFAQRNTNASISETLARFEPVLDLAAEHGIAVRGYVSCAVACPFEGPIAPEAVADVAGRLWDRGVDELDLADTIGAGAPESVLAMLQAVVARIGDEFLDRITLHLHDTQSRAADCVRAAYEFGLRSFDGAVAGLGGCPYASTPERRAPGNLATETLVRVVHECGGSTTVDEVQLAAAVRFASSLRTQC